MASTILCLGAAYVAVVTIILVVVFSD